MSNALAISGVTAVLQYLLNGVYSNLGSVLGGVTVSAVAPDIVQTIVGTGSESPLQVNVFLHQVTLNAAWRDMCLPSLAADGITPLTNPPLALDLHYLLTAYAGADTEAEALLGYAIQLLHLNPVLLRSQIRTALSSVPAATNPLSGVLSSSGLAEQIEMIKITPATLGREEMAWIWTALKADYRPSFAFQVSVVLIQPQLPSSPGLPVLSVSAQVQPSAQLGSQFAQLSAIQLPDGQPGQTAPAQGDPVTVTGTGLGTAVSIALSNQPLGIQYPSSGSPPLAPSSVTGSSVSFTVPTDADNLPAGVYSLSVLYTDTSGAQQSTNSLPMGVAPKILTIAAATNPSGILVSLTCNPNVQPLQTVSLALGSTAAPAQTFSTATDTLSFQFPALSAGQYLARLQVDGVDSPVSVGGTPTSPVFTGPFVTVP